MNKRMTQAQLEAIRKRAEAATEGPWTYVSQTEDKYEMPKLISPEFPIMNFGDCTTFYPMEGTPPDDEDAEFIAHSREDIPALLAEVERLQGIDEIYDEDIGKLERQRVGMSEQSERFYEKYRKEKRDKARSESRLKTEIERLQAEANDLNRFSTDSLVYELIRRDEESGGDTE